MNPSERSFDRWSRDLNLSSAQKTKIKAVHSDALNQAHATVADKSLSMSKRQMQLNSIRVVEQLRIKQILTSTQRQKSTQQAVQRHHQLQQRRLDTMSRDLNLTVAQKAKISGLVESAEKQTRAVRANNSLAPQQQQAQVRAIRTDTKSRINSILTPAQRAQKEKLVTQARTRRQPIRPHLNAPQRMYSGQ